MVAAFDAERAAVSAAGLVTDGTVDRRAIAVSWPTDVDSGWPALSVTTTKSPPYTGRPWWVRRYGTYCRPSLEEMTACCVNVSPAAACNAGAFAATRLAAARAASTVGLAGAAAGAACAAVAVAAATTRAAAAPSTKARFI